jgi:hypothetical protein
MVRLVDPLNKLFKSEPKGALIAPARSNKIIGTVTFGSALFLTNVQLAVNSVAFIIKTNNPFALENLDVQVQPRAAPASFGTLELGLYKIPTFAESNVTNNAAYKFDDTSTGTVSLTFPNGAGVIGTVTPLSAAYVDRVYEAIPVVRQPAIRNKYFSRTKTMPALFVPTTHVLALVVTQNTLPAITVSLDVNYQIKVYDTATTED